MAKAKTVLIGCSFPSGLLIDPPGYDSILLNGQYSNRTEAQGNPLLSSGFGVTEVDADAWDKWVASIGEDFAPLKSGVVFVTADPDKVEPEDVVDASQPAAVPVTETPAEPVADPAADPAAEQPQA